MSINDLPMELHDMVISELAFADICCLSLVSKYWRSAAEPHMYRDIRFHASEKHRIKQLMLTLISRPGLAKHMKELQYVPSLLSIRNEREKQKRFYLAMWFKTQQVQDAIRAAAGPKATTDTWTSWLSSIMGGAAVMDGCMALIVAMASNMECLALKSNEDLPITMGVVSQGLYVEFASEPVAGTDSVYWEQDEWKTGFIGGRYERYHRAALEAAAVARRKMAARDGDLMGNLGLGTNAKDNMKVNHQVDLPPCSKLQHLSIQSYSGDILISCALKTFDLRGPCASITGLQLPTQQLNTPPPLRRLNLRDVSIDMQVLDTAFTSPWFAGLQTLILKHMTYDDSYNYQSLIDTMGTHLPNLTTFHWEHPELGQYYSLRPHNLSRLQSLQELRIDSKLLLGFCPNGSAYQGREKRLLQPKTILPPALNILHICEIAFKHLISLLAPILPHDKGENAMSLVTQLASSYPLAEFSICVEMRGGYENGDRVIYGHQFTDSEDDFIGAMVEQLYHMGTDFLLWKKPQYPSDKRDPEVLYGPHRTYNAEPWLPVDEVHDYAGEEDGVSVGGGSFEQPFGGDPDYDGSVSSMEHDGVE